ncbi:MAG: HAMP domain-containing protein, partial [Elainellaceae cyanobacterium]
IGAAERVEAVVLARIALDTVGYSVLGSGVSEDEEEEGEEFYRLVDGSSTIVQSLPLKAENPEIGRSIAEKIPGFDAVQEQREPASWVGPTADGKALIAYAPVSNLENLGWSVVASEGTADAFAPQQQLLATILLGITATALVAVLLGVTLAKRATRPIEQAARTVELLGQGNLHARMPVRGGDEMAVLGRNINQMAGQIEGLLQTLRQNAVQLGRQNKVLSDLARDDVLIKGDVQGAAQTFGEVAAATLDVERVSFWLYKPEQGQMHCLSYYDRTRPNVAPPPMAIDPAYIQALIDHQSLAISDVRTHSDAQLLIDGGHLDDSTVSLLEVPIQITGKIIGTVRCEQTGDRRRWEPQEQTFVSSVANLAALALESEVLQKEVSHLLDVVSEVEDGNLTIEAQVSDRSTGLVADTFNRLIERLAEVMQQAVETAQQVSQNAQQQTHQADLIANNATQQAEGVNQILQITNGVKTLALEAAQQVETSRTSLDTLRKAVERGRGEITGMTTGIEILQEGSDRIIQQMKTLGEFVGLADQFVQDQTQIASLTQTLALNASLVAARSAEQRDPRQFAVAAREFGAIASQVSQLAQQTNTSLTTLEQRSTQIQSVVYTVDANVQRVGSLVESFTQGVEESSQVFEEVQTVMTAAIDAETLVSQASQEIVDAAESATDVVRKITDTADRTAELTRNNRMQSEQMESLSQQLLQTMVFFQLPALAPEEKPQPEFSQLETSSLST